jgi:type IV pilus assembly protein PilY1
VANIPHFGSTTKAKYVTLLEQSQIWAGGIKYYHTGDKEGEIEEIIYNPDNWRDFDYYLRVLTSNKPNWYNFGEWEERQVTYPDELAHAGWYFDLTLTGERQISDMLLAGGFVVFNSVIPSRSPCESGGNSYGQALDYCSGGNVDTAFYDLNGDGIIDENDLIDIGSPGNAKFVPAVGILNDGINPTPAWLIGNDGRGVLLNPDHSSDAIGDGTGDPNTGEPPPPPVQSIGTESPGYGMYFWRELGR